MTLSRRTARTGVSLGLAVLGSALLGVVVACADDARPERAARDQASAPPMGAASPCATGEVVACGETLAVHDDGLSCYEGVRRCEDGVLGACRDGMIVARPAPATEGGLSPLALSEPSPCGFNPCDPSCHYYDERPASGFASGTGVTWRGGHILDVPATLADRGLNEPCQTGADCQLNHRCASVVTDPACAHDKCEPGDALAATCDPCVARVCAADPSCCDTPCAPGEVLGPNGSSCYFLSTTNQTWAAARAACQARGAGWDLAAVASGTENSFLNSLVIANGAGQTWLGLNDQALAATWVWSSGAPSVYSQWAAGQPDPGGDEHCVEVETSGVWHDYPCSTALDYMCEGPAGAASSCAHDPCSTGVALKATCDPCVAKICAAEPACCDAAAGRWSEACAALVSSTCDRTCGCAPDERSWAGHCYYFEQRSFDQPGAQATCAQRGTGWGLAVVDSAEENAFVRGLSGLGSGNRLWIGFEDKALEGKFTWFDGSPVTHTAFAAGEPNDSGGEDCVEMCNTAAEWNDLACAQGRQSACEGPSKSEKAWTASCVAQVAEACAASCSEPRTGECTPWMPGETEPACTGFDLAVGIPCEATVPVCNHGSATAPAGITLALLPAGSGQYPSCGPDLSGSGVTTCQTDAPIPAGECVNVSGCPGLDVERELVVNPPGATHVAECSCLDNWSLAAPGVACSAPACVARTVTGAQRRLNLFVAIDRSASMALNGKWSGAVAALEAFFQSPALAGVGVALEAFPLESSGANDGCYSGADCSAEPCSRPMVGLGPLSAAGGSADAQETALLEALARPELQPAGATPTSAALGGGIAWGKGLAGDPAAQQVVVLVTDGAPTRCEVDPSRLEALAADGLASGVVTYTIGMEGAENAALAAIASAGGGENFVVGGTNATAIAASLEQALFAIAVRDVECAYALPDTTRWDPAAVTLTTTASGLPGGALAPVADAAACGQGWYFDDPVLPRRIELCPDTCAALRAEPESRVDIEVGCRSASFAERYTQVYQAECAPGQRVQWGFLAWDTSTPNGARVEFEAQVAASQGELAGAEIVPLGSASALEGTQVCGLGSTCLVDVYSALGKVAAGQPVLRLIIEAEPNATGDAMAVVNHWELTYSCPPSE